MEKIEFYLRYLYRKIFSNLFEIKSPRFRLYFVNILYMLSKIFKSINWKNYANVDYVETIFGRFKVRPKTFDVICASPDFERQDVDSVIKILNSLLPKNNSLIFLDIGADFGLYSIIIGTTFKDSKIKIYAFEPFIDSYNLCNENIVLNSLQNKVIAYNFGLYNESKKVNINLHSENPGSNSIINPFEGLNEKDYIKVEMLDSLDIFNGSDGNNILFIKMDVEGAEKYVLEGSINTIRRFKEVYILVEDFIDRDIINYLKLQDFKLIEKLTPYNSLWHKIN